MLFKEILPLLMGNEKIMIQSETVSKYENTFGLSRGNFIVVSPNHKDLSQLSDKKVLGISSYKNLVEITL